MSNRWLRFVIALLALVASGAAGSRIYQQEQRLAADVAAARAADGTAESAILTISELKAALHAYVAAGQGSAFWTKRAAALLDTLRASMLELDGAAAAAGVSPTEALDLADRLGVAEQRARAHVRASQELLAGDVIFTEARDLADSIQEQVLRTRAEIAQAATARQEQLRRQQRFLALGAAGVLAFATLLLVLPGRSVSPEPAVRPSFSESPREVEVDEFESSARLISRVPLNPPPGKETSEQTATASPATPASARERTQPAPAASATGGQRSAAGDDAKRPAVRPESSRTRDAGATVAPLRPVTLEEAAAVCTDLARVSESAEITGLLGRAAKVLDAAGVVIWIASEDRGHLLPAASAGYDDRLLARIGAIPRDDANVTAAAFRTESSQTSKRKGSSAAALAVPLMTPHGPAGVLSAEIREVGDVDAARLSLAKIFAAQVATLVASISVPASDESPAPKDHAPSATAKA